MNRVARVAVRVGLVVGSLAAALLILELAVRALDLEPVSSHSISGFCEYDPLLGWKLIPQHRTIFRRQHFSVAVETNADGLRDRSYPLDPAPGRRRMLVLGDSVAWCWGVEMSECFTKLMEGELDDTDVVTMGVPGYSTAQELLLYETRGSRYGADVVFVVFVGNDPDENLDSRKRPRFVLDRGRLVPPAEPVARVKSPAKEWLPAHSRLYVQVAYGLQVIQRLTRDWKGRAPPPWVEPSPSQALESWSLTEALLDRFRERVARDGARFVLAIMDTPEPFKGRLLEFCRSRALTCADLDPTLRGATERGEPVRLQGDPHLALAGQRLLARALLDSVSRP